jgi:hypothetical protein
MAKALRLADTDLALAAVAYLMRLFMRAIGLY